MGKWHLRSSPHVDCGQNCVENAVGGEERTGDSTREDFREEGVTQQSPREVGWGGMRYLIRTLWGIIHRMQIEITQVKKKNHRIKPAFCKCHNQDLEGQRQPMQQTSLHFSSLLLSISF